MRGKGSAETDNKKGGGGKEDKKFSPILIARPIFMWSIGIVVVYILLHICNFFPIEIDDDTSIDNDVIRTVLGILGVGFLVINIRFVVIRIRESKKTNELADSNLQESKKTTYLNDLHQGISMLYSDSFIRQRGGVAHLHNIAEAYQEDSKRVKQIFEIFRSFVQEIPLEEERKKVAIVGKKRNSTIVIKEEILYKITPEKEQEKNIYKNVNSDIDLRVAQLGFTDLQGSKVCSEGAYLPVWKVYLKGAQLWGANLQGTKLWGYRFTRYKFTACKFTRCRVTRCNFTGHKAVGYKFTGCMFTECRFTGCKIL